MTREEDSGPPRDVVVSPRHRCRALAHRRHDATGARVARAHRDLVDERHGVEDRRDLVIAVGPQRTHAETQIDLGGRDRADGDHVPTVVGACED